jgi:hypothetical protein
LIVSSNGHGKPHSFFFVFFYHYVSGFLTLAHILIAKKVELQLGHTFLHSQAQCQLFFKKNLCIFLIFFPTTSLLEFGAALWIPTTKRPKLEFGHAEVGHKKMHG